MVVEVWMVEGLKIPNLKLFSAAVAVLLGTPA